MGKRGPGLLEGQWEFPTLRLGAVEASEGGGAGKEVRGVEEARSDKAEKRGMIFCCQHTFARRSSLALSPRGGWRR